MEKLLASHFDNPNRELLLWEGYDRCKNKWRRKHMASDYERLVDSAKYGQLVGGFKCKFCGDFRWTLEGISKTR